MRLQGNIQFSYGVSQWSIVTFGLQVLCNMVNQFDDFFHWNTKGKARINYFLRQSCSFINRRILLLNDRLSRFIIDIFYLLVDISWALNRCWALTLEAFGKLEPLPELGIPVWLTLLKGLGLSTFRTPKGAELDVFEVIVFSWNSFDRGKMWNHRLRKNKVQMRWQLWNRFAKTKVCCKASKKVLLIPTN